MPLFFLPFEQVTDWAGLPKGTAARYRWLATKLELDRKLQMDEKTLRKAVRGLGKVSKRTQKELVDLQMAIASKLGAVWPPANPPDEVLGITLRWHEWDGFARYEDANLPGCFLPATRNFIRCRAMAEREVAVSIAAAPDVRSAVVALVDNPLARVLCPEIGPTRLLHDLEQPTNQGDLERFGAANPLLKRWRVHCMVSLLMEILAHADIEFCREHLLPENACTEELVRNSMILRILPTIANGTLIRPIPALLECWSESATSYRKLALMIPGASKKEKANMFKRWRKGKHIPIGHSIEGFLHNLIPNEHGCQIALLRYRIALLLHGLYIAVENALPGTSDQDRVRMFQTFVQHRLKHISTGTQNSPLGMER